MRSLKFLALLASVAISNLADAGVPAWCGFHHFALNGATIATDPTGSMTVQTAGLSDAGFRVDLGQSTSWIGDFTIDENDGFDLGDSCRAVSYASPGVERSTVHMVYGDPILNPFFDVFVTNPNGGTTYDMTLYRDGKMIMDLRNRTGVAFQIEPEAGPGGIQLCKVCFISLGEDGWYAKCKRRSGTRVDGLQVEFDEAFIRPHTLAPGQETNSVEFLTTGIDETEFGFEMAEGINHHPVRGLLNTLVMPTLGQMFVQPVVGEVGGGVSINLGSVTEFDLGIEFFSESPATVTAITRGQFGDEPDHELGTFTWRPAFFDIFVDFSAIGSTQTHVQVLNNGFIVYDNPNYLGGPIVVSRPPSSIRKLGGPIECYAPDWPEPIDLLVDGFPVQGNEVRLLALGVSQFVGEKTQLDLIVEDGPVLVRELSTKGVFRPAFFDVFYGEVFDGDASSLARSDDAKLRLFNDPQNLITHLGMPTRAPIRFPHGTSARFEVSASRPGLIVEFLQRNHETGVLDPIGGATVPPLDTWFDVAYLVGAAHAGIRPIDIQLRTLPVNDEDPAQDGWLTDIDQVANHYAK